MRALLPATVLLTALAGASLQARASDEAAPARGAFATQEAADVSACQHLCAEDALCMAWTFRETGVCELRAVVPPDAPGPGSISGVSARAPATMRRPMAVTQPPAQPKTQPAPAALARNDAADALLGGPQATDLSLRPRHGGPR
jgi:hypothetical protein